jgi:integrase
VSQTPTTTRSVRGGRARPGGRAAKAPQTRRPRGSGGLVEVRPGVWKIDIEIGRDPVTGKRRRASGTAYGTIEDAEVELARLKVADHDGRRTRPGTRARSVGAVLDSYVEEAETGVIELAPKTIVTSRSARNTMCKMVLPDGRVFGDIRLSKLRWEDIEAMYRAMREGGRGADWVRRCATVLARALDRARKHGLIEHNPARDADRPKTVRRKPHSPAKEAVATAVADAQDADAEIADAAIILAATGIRMGELLGLQNAEVDLDGRVVNVSWAVTDGGKGVGILRKPTKRSDWRDVPLTTAAVQAFQRQAERCKRIFGVEPEPGHYVFPGLKGPDVPHRPDTFGDRWAEARGNSSTTFLHLRHYVATTMLDAGEEYRTVADIPGNSETTLRLHYDGRTNVDKRRAVNALEL